MKNSLMANYNIANKFYITGVRRGLGKALKDKKQFPWEIKGLYICWESNSKLIKLK